jgi:hypothetical protein
MIQAEYVTDQRPQAPPASPAARNLWIRAAAGGVGVLIREQMLLPATAAAAFKFK